jgi:hypothetical protein
MNLPGDSPVIAIVGAAEMGAADWHGIRGNRRVRGRTSRSPSIGSKAFGTRVRKGKDEAIYENRHRLRKSRVCGCR